MMRINATFTKLLLRATAAKVDETTPPNAIPSQPGADGITNLPTAPPGEKARKKPAQRAPRKKPSQNTEADGGGIDNVEADNQDGAAGVGGPGKARESKGGSDLKGRGKKKKTSGKEDPAVKDGNGEDPEEEDPQERNDSGGVWGPHGEEVEEEIDLDSSVGYNWTESMEPPAELLMPLLPYQKQFLAW